MQPACFPPQFIVKRKFTPKHSIAFSEAQTTHYLKRAFISVLKADRVFLQKADAELPSPDQGHGQGHVRRGSSIARGRDTVGIAGTATCHWGSDSKTQMLSVRQVPECCRCCFNSGSMSKGERIRGSILSPPVLALQAYADVANML